MGRWRQRLEWCGTSLECHDSHQKLEAARNRIFPIVPAGSTTLLDVKPPASRTLYKQTNFSVCGNLLQQP